MTNGAHRSIVWIAAVLLVAVVTGTVVLGKNEGHQSKDRKQLAEVTVTLNSSDMIEMFFESMKTFAKRNDFQFRVDKVSSYEPKYSVGLRGFGYEIHGANPFRNSEFSFGFFETGNTTKELEDLVSLFEKHVESFMGTRKVKRNS